MFKIVASVFLCVSVSPVFAADYSSPPPQPGPSGALRGSIVDDWTGIYVGANIGYDRVTDNNGIVSDYGSGSTYGAFVGFNYQISDNLVIGLEADYTNYDITFTKASFIDVVEGGSLRGRVGFTLDRALVYATAGITYGTTNINLEDYGAVVGVGVDYKATDNIIVGVSYLHSIFRNFDNANLDANIDAVRGRVAYLF